MAKMGDRNLTRREFLRSSGAVAALASAGVAPGPAARAQVTASEKITLGFIGVAGRGRHLMDRFTAQADVEVAAVCDVYDAHLRVAVDKTGGKAAGYSDFRKLLERRDIDAVVIATPPHWHALTSIYALQAGKDVYCEKPLFLKPEEGRAMLKAARDNRRVTQVGTQVHSSDNFRRAVEIVRSGMLGKIAAVRVIVTMNEYPGGIGNPPDCDPPPGLDWDMWLGPAPEAPFNPARFEAGNHRYFRDYAGSWLLELGPHIVDLAWWAMQPDEPKAISAAGGRFVADDTGDIPDTLDVLWEFDGFTMSWIHTACNSFNFGFGAPPDTGRRLGVMFHGTQGTLMADYGSHQIVSEGDRLKDAVPPPPSIPSSVGHEREFLDGIKTRAQPSCSFEYHVPLGTALTLGQIAFESGRKLFWNSKESSIVGDPAARQLAKVSYRKPWSLPG